jgi:hypothetical protein
VQRLFDLSANEAAALFGYKRSSFAKIKAQLTEGYHYSGRLYSRDRLIEFQQIGHEPELLAAAIEQWKKSLLVNGGK